MKRFGFTLAEVLITLGVIGVVAALTIPTLIQNHQKKVLETQFKKSVSLINQFVLNAKVESGIDKFGEFCTALELGGRGYYNKEECYQILNKITFGIDNTDIYVPILRKDLLKTYNSKKEVGSSGELAGIFYGIRYTAQLPDGIYLNYNINEGALSIIVDTNGAKAPNKLGHDIFHFVLDKNKDILIPWDTPKEYTDEELKNKPGFTNRVGYPCNMTSSQNGNGVGCSYYALKGECPYDNTKRYFDCLPK